nr:zinc finger and SCAN domain-containing protein 29-like [Chelonoidis abingdonii]
MGEEALQSQLHLSCRNFDNYGQVSQDLCEKSYYRDMPQCRAKIKDLRQVYHKAREPNHHVGAAPKTCQLCKELDSILGGDPTTKTPVDTLAILEAVERAPNPEDEVTDEEVELDDDVELLVGSLGGVGSQELFRKCLSSLSNCSLVSKKKRRRCLTWP